MSKKSRPWGRRARARIRRRTKAGPWLRAMRDLSFANSPMAEAEIKRASGLHGLVFDEMVKFNEDVARAADIPWDRLRAPDRGAHDDYVDAMAAAMRPDIRMSRHATRRPGPTAEDYLAAGEFMHEQLRDGIDRARGVIDAEVVQRALPPIPDPEPNT